MEQMQPHLKQTTDASFTQLYPPLARVIPLLRHGPPSVRNSLQVVENYFGATLSPRMIDVTVQLSERQLSELERRLRAEARGTGESLALVERPWQPPAPKSRLRWRPAWERKWDAEDREDLDFFPWSHRPHIAGAREICTHEDLLPGQGPADIDQTQALKHLALYCERTAIRDPLLTPSPPDELVSHALDARRRRLANGLRQLLPLAPLVRSGVFILVAESYGGDHMFDTPLGNTDPFLESIVRCKRPAILEEMAQLRQIRRNTRDDELQQRTYRQLCNLDAQALEVAHTNYPYEISEQAWQQLLTMARWTMRYSLSPMTTDPIILRHFAQGARLALDHHLDATNMPSSSQAAAISYKVPALTNTSFSDIARLRESDLFDEVRGALLELASTCAEQSPSNYNAYQQTVAACAQDVVGPLYRRIVSAQRRNKLLGLGISATVEAVDMSLNGIAGKVAGAAVERLGGRTMRRRTNETDVACSIIKSVLLYK